MNDARSSFSPFTRRLGKSCLTNRSFISAGPCTRSHYTQLYLYRLHCQHRPRAPSRLVSAYKKRLQPGEPHRHGIASSSSADDWNL